ncbi:unnamed protein product [Schistocephalus solidus]|uniref:Cytochrome c oxidase subunit 1 n=1 Tax=Schistocephalus solidus TaxID=70667 RepID=A0A3P7F4S4_SCHSO|nr:unnamed protein product [Schistocephalus solidus]
MMFSLHLAGVSRVLGSINFICTLYSAFVDNFISLYVLILPGFGMVSHVCRNLGCSYDTFGFYGLLFAMFSIVCLGSVVWGHHMFTVGLDVKTAVFFSSVTMIIGVPTGIKVFSWLYMILNSRVSMRGVTGIILSACVLDKILHDTWFVVAHFHYVMSLGSYSLAKKKIVLGYYGRPSILLNLCWAPTPYHSNFFNQGLFIDYRMLVF